MSPNKVKHSLGTITCSFALPLRITITPPIPTGYSALMNSLSHPPMTAYLSAKRSAECIAQTRDEVSIARPLGGSNTDHLTANQHV